MPLEHSPFILFSVFSKIDFMTLKLDENQQKAVEHLQGPALVVAGPGSGKTTVIKERILHLIREHNVDPEQILAIAFTNVAVTELEDRILGELDSKHGHPKIRTLHGFGKDIITDNYREAGFSFPPAVWGGRIKPILEQERERLERNASDAIVAIYKIQSQTTGKCYIGQSINPTHRKKQHFRNSSNSRLRQAIRNEGSSQFTFEIIERVRGLEANERESYWIEHYRNSGGVFNSTNPLRQQYSNQLLIELFCQFFNARDAEEFNKILQEVMAEKSKVETGLFLPSTINDNRVRSFAEKYEAARQKTDAVDYQDMLIYSAHLLESYPSFCQYYCDKYPYVLIDEFQDISRADFRLIKLLSENIFAVGDDDQAIYGFRGGDSKIMLEFADQQNVSKYEITRNYRSTSTIVAHARALIEKNTLRISKDLRPQNPMQQEIKIIESTLETVETSLLPELRLSEETAILTRTNYEIEKIEEIFDDQPFPIEVSTIHKAKGKEWEKVILIVNALDVWDNGSPYISLPDTRNEITEERRVFYVAMTRAKQELIVLGGNCQFILEFQNLSPIEIAKLQRLQTKNELKETLNEVLASLERKFRRELEEEIEAALIRFRQELRQEIKAARTQYEPELRHLRHIAIKAKHTKQNKQKQINYVLPQERKAANNTFLEGLLPVLDEFELQINSLPATTESNSESDDFGVLIGSVQLAHKQMLDTLKNYGLRPIETFGKIFNPTYHEEVLPAVYSNEVKAGWVAREEQRGYLSHDQVIRKAQVVISKGENIREPERLDRVVDIYLYRLISAFQAKYELSNDLC
ncbi:nucleotide exchange factor GrpE [Candidatus Poribacteria bacterium]|nr:MAG: nucleotide exchange factor GrpE [Candidatus Poribacteria bacterium]